MAEKGEKQSGPNVTCPLCLDVFQNATLLTCGHTFCLKCLKKYDESHKKVKQMVCPLCRTLTDLHEKRVEGLPQNVSINELVDEYNSSAGCMTTLLEFQHKCASCTNEIVAVSYCSDCDVYMCDACYQGHTNMQFLFAEHHVVSVEDLVKGEISIDQQSDRCPMHKQEKKDLFCENCRLHICLKCVIVHHRDHKIKNQDDFEKEIGNKINDLVHRGRKTKACIEQNVHTIELQRQEVQSSMRKLEEQIKEAHVMKTIRLEQEERSLLEDVKSLQKYFEDDLDAMKTTSIQQIKQITNSMTLVSIQRLKNLETDSLTAHTLICSELDILLKETIDEESAGRVKDSAKTARFHPADAELLTLGIVDVQPASVNDSHDQPAVTPASGLIYVDKAQKVYSQSLQLINAVSVSNSTLTLVRDVDLTFYISGMAALSRDNVVIGYGDSSFGSDSFRVSGDKTQYMGKEVGNVRGITFLTDGRSVVSHGTDTLDVYNADGSPTDINFKCQTHGEYYCSVVSDENDNIYTVNGSNAICIYQVGNEDPHRVIPTGDIKPVQICVTTSGTMITSTCYRTPSTITVYDREGHMGSCIKSPDDEEELYAAVDSQDRVFIARVKDGSEVLQLSIYTVVLGKSLIEQITFRNLQLRDRYHWSWWCYLVCLTPHMLAFARNKKLYFIDIPI